MTSLTLGYSMYIITYTGKAVYPLDLTPEQIDMRDIAHALAIVSRFTGHCSVPYSVAQHSIMVSRKCDPGYALQGLLHDATEAYFADIARPVKQQIADVIKPIEDRIWAPIAEKFGVPFEMHESVHVADRRALYTEAKFLMNPDGISHWDWHAEPYDDTIVPMGWEQSERAFLKRFEELKAV